MQLFDLFTMPITVMDLVIIIAVVNRTAGNARRISGCLMKFSKGAILDGIYTGNRRSCPTSILGAQLMMQVPETG
jgi:hypothetical protein